MPKQIHTAAEFIPARPTLQSLEGKLLFDLPIASAVMATVHPSSILRAPDEEARRDEMTHFVYDLGVAAAYIGKNVKRAA
jgi:hypothetical protein